VRAGSDLATVIDLATRMVVGWQLAEHLRTGLVTDALGMAIAAGHTPPGAVFHSDRGCQPRLKESSQHRLVGAILGDR
jgi:transposase InsO family protein